MCGRHVVSMSPAVGNGSDLGRKVLQDRGPRGEGGESGDTVWGDGGGRLCLKASGTSWTVNLQNRGKPARAGDEVCTTGQARVGRRDAPGAVKGAG